MAKFYVNTLVSKAPIYVVNYFKIEIYAKQI